MRDPTNHTYFKEETGKIMAGFFEPRGKIWNLDGIPRDFCFGSIPEDWEHERDRHTFMVVTVAGVEVLTLRMTYVGYHAMNTLRMEAGSRHWGYDITDEDTPVEAGLAFAVAWDKPDGFLGQPALLAQRGATKSKRLVQFVLGDPDRLVYHDEPLPATASLLSWYDPTNQRTKMRPARAQRAT